MRRRDARGALRWLAVAALLVAVGARMDNGRGSYPLQVHQMFLQQRNGGPHSVNGFNGHSGNGYSNGNGNGHGTGSGNGNGGGAWSSWSRWSPCSRSCGGGVAAQTRECRPLEKRRRRLVTADASPHNATRPSPLFLNGHAPKPASVCVGVYKRFHICNDKPCPPGSKDFRLLQCEAFNRKPMSGHFYTWIPYLEAKNACELNCRPVGEKFYARLNASVVDGTPCPVAAAMPPSRDASLAVCVAGVCKAVGCDGVVGSARRPDACGVCGGDNSTCRLVSGLFTRTNLPRVGYHLIATLPRGACNISVTELKHSRNFLALRRQDGSYVINGNWAISWSGEYEAAGSRVVYRRQDAAHLETVTVAGPLTEPLDIMVIYQQPNPGIKYEYTLPMKASDPNGVGGLTPAGAGPHATLGPAPAPPLLLPPAAPQSGAGRMGENGMKDVYAADAADKRPESGSAYPFNGVGVQGTESQPPAPHLPPPPPPPLPSQHLPHPSPPPPPPQPRTRGRRRKFAWRTAGYTECSRTCGGGVQTFNVECVREHGQIPVPMRRCAGLPRPPPQMIRCAIKPCPAQWTGGEWGACSVSCGQGVQERGLLCQQQVSPTLTMAVAAGACLGPEPSAEQLPRTRRCLMPACAHGADPHADAHSETHADPRLQDSATAAAGEERGEAGGDSQQELPAPRSATVSRWQAGPWGKCSTSCGPGHRSRQVQCTPAEGDDGAGAGEVEAGCPPEARPVDVEACDLGPCVPPSAPAPVPPADAKAIAHGPLWLASEWSHQCSAPCGTGVQARRVLCWPGSDESSCDAASRPTESRACASDKQCPGQWFTGPWGQCSARCGRGRQTRHTACVAVQQGIVRVVPDSSCAMMLRPEHERSCLGHDCGPDWFSSEWLNCSRDCGGGTQRRDVKCLDQHQRPSSDCPEEKRPAAKRTCNTHECGTVQYGNGSSTTDKRLKDEPASGRETGYQGVSSDDKAVRDDECIDRIPNCHLVVQARLCTLYKSYRFRCCHSCHKKV